MAAPSRRIARARRRSRRAGRGARSRRRGLPRQPVARRRRPSRAARRPACARPRGRARTWPGPQRARAAPRGIAAPSRAVAADRRTPARGPHPARRAGVARCDPRRTAPAACIQQTPAERTPRISAAAAPLARFSSGSAAQQPAAAAVAVEERGLSRSERRELRHAAAQRAAERAAEQSAAANAQTASRQSPAAVAVEGPAEPLRAARAAPAPARRRQNARQQQQPELSQPRRQQPEPARRGRCAPRRSRAASHARTLCIGSARQCAAANAGGSPDAARHGLRRARRGSSACSRLTCRGAARSIGPTPTTTCSITRSGPRPMTRAIGPMPTTISSTACSSPTARPMPNTPPTDPIAGPDGRVTTGSAPSRAAAPGRVTQATRDFCADQAKGVTAWPLEQIARRRAAERRAEGSARRSAKGIRAKPPRNSRRPAPTPCR